LIADNKDQIEY